MESQGTHPVWCTREGCEDGVHTSRVWVANLGGEIVGVSAYLQQFEHNRLRVQGIVLIFEEDSERQSYLIELPQAQALLHILRKLTRLA